MAHKHLHILEVLTDEDPTTRTTRIRAVVQEMQPRKYNINLSKQSADVINKFTQHVGGIAMVPVREGVLQNGNTFVSYDPDSEFIGVEKPKTPFIKPVNP